MTELLTQGDMAQIMKGNQTIQTLIQNLFSLKVINHKDLKKSVFLESKTTTRKICVRANLLVHRSRGKVGILACQTNLTTLLMQRISRISRVKIQDKAMGALIQTRVYLQETRRLLVIRSVGSAIVNKVSAETTV